MTVNDGSNDDDDNNDDGDEAIWESLDSDAAVVLLCVGCEDEVHLACLGSAAVPDGDWFCRACQPSASAKAAAQQVHEAVMERKQKVKNARGGDDEEKDDTDEDQVNLCIALVYVPRGVL